MSKVLSSLEMSGHTHYGSPYETATDCGNCDGARCHKCNDIYVVTDYDTMEELYRGSNIDKAVDLGFIMSKKGS